MHIPSTLVFLLLLFVLGQSLVLPLVPRNGELIPRGSEDGITPAERKQRKWEKSRAPYPLPPIPAQPVQVHPPAGNRPLPPIPAHPFYQVPVHPPVAHRPLPPIPAHPVHLPVPHRPIPARPVGYLAPVHPPVGHRPIPARPMGYPAPVHPPARHRPPHN